MSANDKQISGTHYKTSIEPWDAIIAWDLGYLDGSVVKYISRWKKKNGLEDLLKAQHFLEKLIEQETKNKKKNEDEYDFSKMYKASYEAYLKDKAKYEDLCFIMKQWHEQK